VEDVLALVERLARESEERKAKKLAKTQSTAGELFDKAESSVEMR
jgi:hypothetical protein